MLTMPTSKARILAAIIIFAPLFMLAVSVQGYHQRKPIRSVSREFLDAHNKVRVRMGEPPMIWDRGLARYARRYASKRVFDCKMVHSFGPYGENIFWGGRDHWTPMEVVRSWVSEHKFYQRNTNECAPGQMCGHYTQIVWRQTHRLGCARVKCITGGLFALCVYDPPGNFIDESPFGDATNPLAKPSPPSSSSQPPSA